MIRTDNIELVIEEVGRVQDSVPGCNRSDPINGVVKLPLRFGAEPELGGVRPTGLVKRGSLAQMEVYQSRPRERTPPCPNLPHPAGPSQARLPMIWLSGWVAA